MMCLGVFLLESNFFGTLSFLDLHIYFLCQIGEVLLPLFSMKEKWGSEKKPYLGVKWYSWDLDPGVVDCKALVLCTVTTSCSPKHCMQTVMLLKVAFSSAPINIKKKDYFHNVPVWSSPGKWNSKCLLKRYFWQCSAKTKAQQNDSIILLYRVNWDFYCHRNRRHSGMGYSE